MNSFFMKKTIQELKTLIAFNDQSIENAIKSYKKERIPKLRLDYLIFVNDLFQGNLTDKQIRAFLNRKYNGQKVKDFIQIEKATEGSNYVIKNIHYDELFDFEKNLILSQSGAFKFSIISKNLIINLITFYEGFLRSFFITDCLAGNNAIIKNEQLSFEKMEQFSFDSEKIRTELIEAYCQEKLRGDNKRINNVIALLGIDCKDCTELIEDFEEIYFRRNMYVHSIERVTSDYRSLPERITSRWLKDNKLVHKADYNKHAIEIVSKIILMIMIKKSLFSEQSNSALLVLEQIIYTEYYDKENYQVAMFAYQQLKKLSWISDTDRYRFFINYMVCLKQLEKTDLIEMELKKWNVHTTASIYKLAKKLIENDYLDINKIIISILKTESEFINLSSEDKAFYITIDDIQTWPLFMEYRKTEEYKVLLTEIS